MRKLKILELDVTVIRTTFVPHGAGVWSKVISVSEAQRAASPITTIFSATWDTSMPSETVDIGSVRVNEVLFSNVSSLATLKAQNPSWYYDFPNQILYLYFTNARNTNIADVYKIGETIGFLSESQMEEINGLKYPLNAQIGAAFFDPRLEDISVTDTVDDQQNGIFTFDDLAASIKNADGTYDAIREDVTGNEARLLIADVADSPEEAILTGFPYKDAAVESDFKVVRRAIIEDVDYTDPNVPTIKAIDQRSNWEQTISTSFLTTAEFSTLPDKFVNKRKPLAIGIVNGIKAIPLRDDAAAAAFDYFVIDTQYGAIQSVSGVYFDGELGTGSVDRFLTGGEYSINLSTGIITINNCVKGDVYVNGVFTTMSETVEIILFLLLTFDGLAYISSNFNVTEINIVKALGYNTHIYIDESGEKLRTVIEKLIMDIQVDFFQQGSVLTMRTANNIRQVSEEIPSFQIIENPPGWTENRASTIKTIDVTYSIDYRTEEGLTYYNDTKQAVALKNDRKAIDQTFTVNLTQASDVAEIFAAYYTRYVEISRDISFSRIFPFSAGLTDFITFQVVRKTLDSEKVIFPTGIYKIISIDRINNSVETVFFSLLFETGGSSSTAYDWYDCGSSTTTYNWYDGGNSKYENI